MTKVPTGWYTAPGRSAKYHPGHLTAHQYTDFGGTIWTAEMGTVDNTYNPGVEVPPTESKPDPGGQYAARLERTNETLHAERAMLLAESDMHRLRAAWREKQRDHLQIELRERWAEVGRATKLAEDRQSELEALEPLLSAVVTYHAAEFMGWKVEGLDPKEIRDEFSEQVEAYRQRVGLSGVATEVPF